MRFEILGERSFTDSAAIPRGSLFTPPRATPLTLTLGANS